MTPTLVSYVWEQILAERLCAARMDKITESPRLTARDRADLDSLIRDEHHHAAWLRDCLGPAQRDTYPGTWAATIAEHQVEMRTLTPEESIVTIYLPERMAVRTLARQTQIFAEAGEPVLASCYTQILGEERRHVEVNARILRHLLTDAEAGPRVRAYYHESLRGGHYRNYHYDFLRAR